MSLARPGQRATMKDFRWGSEECRDLFPDRLWQVRGGLRGSVGLTRHWAVATGVTEEGLAKGMELSITQCIMYMGGINQLALGLTTMPSCRITLHIVLDLSLDTTVKHF